MAAVDGATSTVAFLTRQVERLEPFDFVIAGVAGRLLDAVEIDRNEDGSFTLTLPPRPPTLAFTDEQRETVHAAGFSPEQTPSGATCWRARVADAAGAVRAAADVLESVWDGGDAVDVHHGSRRAEHEAEAKVVTLRKRLMPLLAELLGRAPTVDEDGDFMFRFESATIFVAPRATVADIVVLRVFAITNIGVNVTPELALFLARLNFGLAFGRFTLDVEHQAVWFDETLLGERATDDELRFTIQIVANTADEWDDRIKAMFGGSTGEDLVVSKSQGIAPPPKPGEGGYL